jgi:hypothetical protein
MEAVSATELSQAGTAQQASILALKTEAQNQQALSAMLARQAEQQAQQVTPAANPEGVGENVDTYA